MNFVILTAVRLCLVSLFALRAGSVDAALENNTTDIGQMNFMELCQGFDQTCEEHEIRTADGYLLTVHRIRGDKTRPVLLWHGLFLSSDSFLLRGLNSTTVSLAEAGHDVWVANSRGNKYSRRHVHLDPVKDKKFWDFSFHEMAVHDMTATIDYILNKTEEVKLSVIGHSQGTSIFYVLTSTQTNYNDKIKLFIAMAPVVFLKHLKTPLNYIISLWPIVEGPLELTGTYAILRAGSPASQFIKLFCALGDIGNKICEDGVAMAVICGYDPEEIEPDFFQVILKHFPAGTSTKHVNHFVQVYNRNQFANYDYGIVGNLKKYDAISPPVYDLKQVTAPVVVLGYKIPYMLIHYVISFPTKFYPNPFSSICIKEYLTNIDRAIHTIGYLTVFEKVL